MIEVQAPITNVTVYTDRAQITRKGRVAFDKDGAQELAIGGLPSGLDADSLRASGRGTVAVTIIGVESRTRFLAETAHEGTRDLQSQLRDLQDRDNVLVRRDEVLSQRLATVQQLSDSAASRFARGLAEGKTSLENAAQLLDFVANQTTQIKEERFQIERERRDLIAQLNALKEQVAQMSPNNRKRDNFVSVSVEAQSAGEWELELSYTIRNASWLPVYDARLATNAVLSSTRNVAPSPNNDGFDSVLTLTYGAMLSQKSGEDWNDSHITLSTARPSLGSLPPKLEPVLVDVYAPPMPRAMAMPMMARSRTFAESDEAAPGGAADAMSNLSPMPELPEPAPPVEAQTITAQVEENGATVTFRLPRPMSVPSDGQPHRAQVATQDLPCKLDFVSVPRRASLGFLRATTRNDSALNLLPGKANIFRDGEFAGSTQLESVAPTQEFKLFLGPDEQVRVERELTAREVEKNLLGNVRRHHFSYVIKLENLKTFPVRLTVLDQVPVSRNESIKVKLRETNPAPQTNEMGELRWELTLQPNSKSELHFEYSIEAPRDAQVTGLD